MRKKKKELSREEKNKMVKEAMWKKACKGNLTAAKIYREMDKEEMEEGKREPTFEEIQQENKKTEELIDKIDKMQLNKQRIEIILRDKNVRKMVREELKKYKDED